MRVGLTVTVFALVYVWLITSHHHRAKAIWLGLAALFLLPPLLGQQAVLRLGDLFALKEDGGWAAVNWNVIGIFAGTLLMAEAFIYSRVPALLADMLLERSPTVGWAILATCIFASAISAVAENVATVLIVAPIAAALARKLRVSPAPFIVGIAISSNLQGTATLIGDPPSMILAASMKMNFNSFFWYQGRPGIFFAVQAGAVAGFFVLWLMFRHYRQPVEAMERERPRSWLPTAIMVVMIGGLAGASSVDPDFLWFGGTLCMVTGSVAWVWIHRHDRDHALKTLKDYDFSTTFFLIGVFTLVYALETTGAIDAAAGAVATITGDSTLGAFVLVVAVSVAISAFVDNVPYLAAMLPLVHHLSASTPGLAGSPLLPFGLLIGSCLGGNVTPIGASANIVAYGMLNRDEPGGFRFIEFVRIGLPFTLAAVAAGSAFLWAVWMWF
jgi:Na+/H+ antiporter NhaD/arsenite permease-like protein